MKAFKKLLAIVLAVCMLIGMPLSIDVAAVRNDSANKSIAFDWLQALLIPDEWSTGLPSGRSFSLYFNGNVNIDTDTVGAAVSITNKGGFAQELPIDGMGDKVRTHWPATIKKDSRFGNVNNYVVTVDESVDENVNHANLLNTIKNYTGSEQLKLVVRLYDKQPNTTGNGRDGYVNGVTAGSSVMKSKNQNQGLGNTDWAGVSEDGSKNTGNTRDHRDIEITVADEDATPHLLYARYSNGKLTVKFSQDMLIFGSDNNTTFPHFRVVNAAGEYMYKNGTDYKPESEAVLLSGYSILGGASGGFDPKLGIDGGAVTKNTGDTYTWNLNLRPAKIPYYTECVNAVAALNAAAGSNEYSVVFAMEEAPAKLKAEKGEAANNGYIDVIWSDGTYRPLLANYRSINIGDSAWVKLLSDEDLAPAEVIQGILRINQTDALITVPSIDSYGGAKSWRILDGTTGQTKVISGTEAIWKVNSFEKYRDRNTQLMASGIATNLNVNTFDGICNLMNVDAGDKLVFAISDEVLNGKIEDFYYYDGSGYKAQKAITTATEDVAYIEIDINEPINTQPVTVLSARQISKKQILVKFSEAVTVDSEPFVGLRLVDGNDELIWSGRDKATGITVRNAFGTGTAMQWTCSNWEMTAEDEMLVTFKQDVAVIMDASSLPASLSPASNDDYEIKLVIEETEPKQSGESPKSGFVCDIVSKANPTKMLVSTSKHVGNTSWDGNATSVEVMTDQTMITASDAKITGENQVTFEWSHAVDLSTTSTYWAAFRYVNKESGLIYGSDKEGWMQLEAKLTYVDEAKCKMTAHIKPNNEWGVYDINDMLNPTNKELKDYMAANPGKWVLCIEEKNGSFNAVIDSFAGVDGTTIQANPFIGSWADGVYMDVTGTPIVGELSITNVELISDIQVKVTFSAPVEYAMVNDKESMPYVAMRLYNKDSKLLFWNPYTEEYTTTEAMKDKDGNRVYKNQDGYTLEAEGYNAEGKWVKYAAQTNQAMQWPASNIQWGDDAHTTIIYSLGGAKQLPIQNMTDLLNYDFSVFGEGCFVGFAMEENTPAMIAYSCHVDNIVRKDNNKIALDANFFPHDRDSVMVTLDNVKISYKPYKITSSTRIISDSQIRISFSEPVRIDNNPYMAIRMIDKEGNLMWNGAEEISTPYQWTGSWEWEDDSHRAIIWTMNSGILGGRSIYELANWVGPLGKYKDEGTWMFVIEELDNSKAGFKAGRFNNLVDNVSSLDGTVHLTSTYSKGLDGILTRLNVEDLVGPEIELLSAKALDDQTIELTFSESVNMDEDVSLAVRYLSPSGDSDVLTDGKVASFKGDWEYKDDTKKVITWKLKSKNADNLTDIFNYNGNFEWNKGSRVAFVIMDAEDNWAPVTAMKINGVYDLQKGFRRLKANYATDDYPMTQMDVEILYDIPAPEASGKDPLGEIIYVTNYIPFIIASAVIVAAGLAVAIVLFKKRKKNEQ